MALKLQAENERRLQARRNLEKQIRNLQHIISKESKRKQDLITGHTEKQVDAAVTDVTSDRETEIKSSPDELFTLFVQKKNSTDEKKRQAKEARRRRKLLRELAALDVSEGEEREIGDILAAEGAKDAEGEDTLLRKPGLSVTKADARRINRAETFSVLKDMLPGETFQAAKMQEWEKKGSEFAEKVFQRNRLLSELAAIKEMEEGEEADAREKLREEKKAQLRNLLQEKSALSAELLKMEKEASDFAAKEYKREKLVEEIAALEEELSGKKGKQAAAWRKLIAEKRAELQQLLATMLHTGEGQHDLEDGSERAEERLCLRGERPRSLLKDGSEMAGEGILKDGSGYTTSDDLSTWDGEKGRRRKSKSLRCFWYLAYPRVLVCAHPILGELRAQQYKHFSAGDPMSWQIPDGYRCEAAYDHEIYTICNPHYDDEIYRDRMTEWKEEDWV